MSSVLYFRPEFFSERFFFYDDLMGVMSQSIRECVSHYGIGEYGYPVVHGSVACKNNRLENLHNIRTYAFVIRYSHFYTCHGARMG